MKFPSLPEEEGRGGWKMDWEEKIKNILGMEESEEGEVEVIVRGESVTVPRITVAELFERLGLEKEKYIVIDMETAEPLDLDSHLPNRSAIVPVRVDG